MANNSGNILVMKKNSLNFFPTFELLKISLKLPDFFILVSLVVLDRQWKTISSHQITFKRLPKLLKVVNYTQQTNMPAHQNAFLWKPIGKAELKKTLKAGLIAPSVHIDTFHMTIALVPNKSFRTIFFLLSIRHILFLKTPSKPAQLLSQKYILCSSSILCLPFQIKVLH